MTLPRHCRTCDFHRHEWCQFRGEYQPGDAEACKEYENDYWKKTEGPQMGLNFEGEVTL